MDKRLTCAKEFVLDTEWGALEPIGIAGDASARRYFRLSGKRSAILMDAPPGSGQSTDLFLSVGSHLRSIGLSVPQIYKAQSDSGFLLMEDFGDAIFAKVIQEAPDQELPLYRLAKDVICELENLPPPSLASRADIATMTEMIRPAFHWYGWAATGSDLFPGTIRNEMSAQLEKLDHWTYSLRDFHVENLIWLPDRAEIQQAGLLDFQDALVLPAGYDLCSLLMDARRDVSDHVSKTIVTEYADERGLSASDVHAALAILGTQRNLRILGVFVRLALKFNKPRYIDFIPRVWRYVEQSLQHPTLAALAQEVLAILPPPSDAMLKDLRNRCWSVPNRS